MLSRGRFSVVIVSLLLAVVWSIRTHSQPVRAASPTFVGAQACATCHAQVHADWKSGRHSKMIQPATPASVLGDFSKDSVTLKGQRYRLRVANGEYFITESYLTGQGAGAQGRAHARQPAHPALPDDDRATGRIIVLPPSWDVQRQRVVRQHGDRPAGRERSEAGPAVEQELRRVPRQPAGQQLPAGGPHLRDASGPTSARRASGVTARAARTSQAYTRGRERRAAGEHSIVRPTRLDPKTSSMICAQCHSLRDVDRARITPPARTTTTISSRCSSTDRARRRIRPYWADGRPRRFSNDAIGLWQSECFLRGGATCTSCHRDPHDARCRQERAAGAGEQRAVHRCHQEIGGAADRAHASPRRQRRQLLRRVPHAEDGDQHQGDDARSHDRPAGAGEHRRVRHPQRVHRVPRGQARRRGRSSTLDTMVAARPARETGRSGRRRSPPRARTAPRRSIA